MKKITHINQVLNDDDETITCELDDLVYLAAQNIASSYDLDDLIYQVAENLASSVNNESTAGQVEFIKTQGGFSDADIIKALNEKRAGN